MSNNVTKILSIKDSAFGSGSRKKFKKRKHKNKYRSSNRKRQRKFHSANKTGSNKSDVFKPLQIDERVMSNWYWTNYKKAIEWQNRHKIAHWKSCALALLEENRYLLQIINSMHPSMAPEACLTQQSLENQFKFKKNNLKRRTSDFNNFLSSGDHYKDVDFDENAGSDDDDDGDGDNDDDIDGNDDNMTENDEIEFEMSEEMMEFFAQSYKHKMDLKKLQEKELQNNAEQEVKQIQNNKIKRSTEMKFLYGEGASMIIGMETAVQLSFDKYCDTKSPKYWPNIPFKL